MKASFEDVWDRVTAGSDNELTVLRHCIMREQELRLLCRAPLQQGVAPVVRDTLRALGAHAETRLLRLQALHCLRCGIVWKQQKQEIPQLELIPALEEIYRRLAESMDDLSRASGKAGQDVSALFRLLGREEQADAVSLRRLTERLLASSL